MSSADARRGPDRRSREVAEVVERLGGLDPGTLDLETVQVLMSTAVRAYGSLVDRDAAGSPFPPDEVVNATDAVRAASAILRAARLETFELALWESFGGCAGDRREHRP